MEPERHVPDRLIDELFRGRVSRGEFVRRALALGLSASAIVSALAACGGDDGGGEAAPAGGGGGSGAVKDWSGRTLNAQVWPGSYEEVYTEQVYKPFEQASSGKIASTTTFEFFDLTRIRQEVESGDPKIDISVLLPSDVIRGGEQGLFEEITEDNVPNLAKLRDSAKALLPNGVAYLVYSYGFGKHENIADMKGIDPTRWEELWDPKLERTITVGTQHVTYFMQSINLMLHGQLTPIEDDAWDKLEELSPNIHSLQDTAQQQDLLTREEAPIAITFDGRIWTMQDADAPVHFQLPEGGAYANADYFGVVKDSPNADMAFDLLNFVLAAEQQHAIGLNLHYGPTNSEVTFEGAEGERVIWTDEQFAMLHFEDAQQVAENVDAWTEKWNEWTASL